MENAMKHDSLVFLGFDLKVAWDGPRTVDRCLWEQSDEALDALKGEGYEENLAQLMNCPVSVIENHVGPNIVGVAVFTTPDGLNVMESILAKLDRSDFDAQKLISRGWAFEGFDVADANGYFSVYGIDYENSRLNVGKALFKSESEVNEFCRPAAQLYPEHSPFITFAVFTFDWNAKIKRGGFNG